MALIDAALNSLGNDLATLAPYLSLHSADPGTTGINETAAARQAANWVVDADGDLTATDIAFTGGTASGAVTHVGLWSAVTGGTFYGSYATTGDAAFNSEGEYTVDVTINGTAS